MLASYTAKMSYQIGEYDMAYSAARIAVEEACELTSYLTPDQKPNHLYAYRLRESVVKSWSFPEIRALGESLYIMALCERRRLVELRERSPDLTPIVFQEKQQKLTNWLVLASLLNSCLKVPMTSIPFVIPD
jgi:hypothetical protein